MESIVNRCRDGEEEDFETLRDRLIVVFFYATGLRLAELVAIDVDDFSDDWRSLRVVGKGDKERLVPILDPLVDQILAYRDAISRQQICKSGEKALFLTCKGVRVSRSKVYRVVQKALQEGGVQGKKSPHVLRHTFATHLMNAGADMREIQELMGHSSLQSTQVYTHNSIARLSEVYAVAHPRQRTEKGTKKE
jgi:integrase/recombinase XerC